MRSTLRRTTVGILLMILLAPGLVQARTAARSWHWVKVDGPAMEQGFFSMVWNLLASFWEDGGTGGSAQLKNGGQADPSGSTSGGTGPGTTSSTSETGTGGSTGGDNGGQADPSGG